MNSLGLKACFLVSGLSAVCFGFPLKAGTTTFEFLNVKQQMTTFDDGPAFRFNSSLESTTVLRSSTTSNEREKAKRKRIVLIRHGTTLMNEKMATPGTMWGDPGFVDDWSFRDTSLSEQGMFECEELLARDSKLIEMLGEIDLVAVSPLTRTLQTFHYGIYLPHYSANTRTDGDSLGMKRPRVVALAEAAERVYLTSDIGSCVNRLSGLFPYVDFQSELPRMMMDAKNDDARVWWWTPERFNLKDEDIEEWRPRASIYVNVGEPEAHFEHRMTLLYKWLEGQPYNTICLVSHWGVIQWLSGRDFRNCQVEVVYFDELVPMGFSVNLS